MPKTWTYEEKKDLFMRLDNLGAGNKSSAMHRHQGNMWIGEITTDIYFSNLQRIIEEYEHPQPVQPQTLVDSLNSMIDNSVKLTLDKGMAVS